MVETRSLDNEVEELLTSKVDDLVKFHIVNLLYEDPTTVGDSEFFAHSLGFYSLEQTKEALEELVDSGVLKKEKAGRRGVEAYGLRRDHKLMRLLGRIYGMDQHIGKYGDILSRLAARSVVRAGMAAGMIGN
jgi:hypothetical protein